MADYVKGEKPRDLDAAVGGLVLERTRNFQKEGDDYHPLGTGLSGPENTQAYDKKGSPAKRTGDKSLAVGSLKK